MISSDQLQANRFSRGSDLATSSTESRKLSLFHILKSANTNFSICTKISLAEGQGICIKAELKLVFTLHIYQFLSL